MKHRLLASAAFLLMTASVAVAQSAPANNSTTPPAIATTKGDSNTTAAPVAGKNSFTEGQARSQLEKHGFTQVTDLKQDDKSIWRGKGMKDGKSVAVSVDYQGNVVGE